MKYVLISGASGGMGKQTVSYLLKQGYYVFALDNKEIEKQENVCPILVDVTDEASINEAFKIVSKITDSLDAIIHFAGIYMLDSLVEISKEKLERIFEINFFGVYSINKIFLPLLKSNSRIIITTSELAPLNPLPFTGIYAISKTALDKYAYSLNMELQLLNIKVSVLRAGAIKTNMLNVSTSMLDEFVNKTKLYKCNATRFKNIVDNVETKSVLPIKVASKVYKILNKKKPAFADKINNNFYLKLLSALPKRWQFFIIKRVLKNK